MNLKLVIACILGPLACAAQDTLVNWGGTYLSEGKAAIFRYSFAGAPDELAFVTPAINHEIRSPTRDYREGPSSVFFANAAVIPPTIVNLAAVTPSPTGDQLSVQIILPRNTAVPPGGVTLEGHFQFHWLVPARPGRPNARPDQLSLEAKRSVSVDLSAIARWMVRVNGEWFLSDQVGVLGDQHQAWSARFAELREWHPYPAARSLIFNPAQTVSLPAGRIEALGFYLYARREAVSNPEQLFRVDVRRFTITAAP